MFEATQRQNFLDLLRPPAGYRLESAVGTTYSLDFVALTAALLALVDAEAESDEKSTKNIESLHAITRLADRVRVFVNRGQISGPRQVSRVTVLYDRIVHEVCLAEGCFHPKVWVTHYRPRTSPGVAERPGVIRVICASRNLTTSQFWEAFVAFEGQVGKGKVAGSLNVGVREFLRRLLTDESHPSPIVDLLREALSRTTFHLPRPLQKEAEFLWQWHGGQGLHRHLPTQGRRALVISPFVRKSFLEDILNRFDKAIIVSSQRELDAIADNVFMARLCGAKNRVYVVSPADTDDGGTAMDLHAKILVFEDANGPNTFLGSANASHSAWKGRNCEALVRFAPGVSIDHFCDRFIFSNEPAKPGGRRPLRGWITEYQRQPFVEDEHEHAKRNLSEFCVALSRLELCATYDPEVRCLRLALKTVPPELPAVFFTWASTWEIQVALLSQLHSDAALKPFRGLIEGGIDFGEVGITDLTEFLVVQVTHRKLGLQRRFILKANADFAQWRELRDSQLLQQLLTRDNLQAFLRAILFDAAVRPPMTPSDGPGNEGVAITRLLSDLTIEDVIRSCTEDTSRIEEINKVLKAFEKTQLIDEEFRQFWATFVAAEEEAREVAAHG
ncbi:hypothetical protein D4S03_08760 [bacterium]|nr:MAG: hypothetical protein D4S03_08760 [bacterium]